MKGDFTRIPTRRSRRFSGVRLQQGRVQLDADFNEQVEIGARRDRLTARDVIGVVGAPEEGGGFEIVPAVELMAIALSGSGGVVAGELGSVYTTTDSGATWSAAHAPVGTPDLYGAALPATGTIVVVGAGGTIMRLDSSGWTAASVPTGIEATLRGISFANADRGWAVGDGATILSTDDGGNTWSEQSAPAGVGENLTAVHFAGATKGWVVGAAGCVITTVDGGTSWVKRPVPDGFDADLHAVGFASESNGIAAGAGGAILVTADGGETWGQPAAPAGVATTLRGLALSSGGHAWAVGDGGTGVASHDDGVSWVELDLDEVAAGIDLAAVATIGDRAVAAGDLGTVLFTGEAAWQQAPLPIAARDFALSAGRLYADGVLVENERGARLFDQPHLDLEPPDPETEAGRYLVYLDAWERHVTAVEEPSLREIALGGPDTATRTETLWQAKLVEVADDAECRDFGAMWAPGEGSGGGRMRAQAEPDAIAAGECAVPASGGYRRLENQLYRVEVHEGGDASDDATFLWSRDNGSVLSRLVGAIGPDPESGNPVLRPAETGRDAVGGFFGAKLVELSDEARLLAGKPGVLVPVNRVDEGRIELEDPGFDLAAEFGPGALVRRWDGTADLVANGWISLEGGVRVQFGAGAYATGDYWTVPARTTTGEVEWPEASGAPQFEPRHGTAHAHAPLALVDLAADGTWTLHDDCRLLFSPLVHQTKISMAGGDGQELEEGAASPKLAYPLEVSVMNGRRPVEGAQVCFKAFEGDGALEPADGMVETDGSGIAGVDWSLNVAKDSHRVRAQLLDRLGSPLNAPVHFNARIAAAGDGEPGPCTITVRPGGDLAVAVEKLREAGGGELCLAAGVFELHEPLVLEGLGPILISGRGPATVLRGHGPEAVIAQGCEALALRRLRIEAGPSLDRSELVGVLSVDDVGELTVSDCSFAVPDREKGEQACLLIRGPKEPRTAGIVERNRLQVGTLQFGIVLESTMLARVTGNDVALAGPPAEPTRETVDVAIAHLSTMMHTVARAAEAMTESEAEQPMVEEVSLEGSDAAIRVLAVEELAPVWRAFEHGGNGALLEREGLEAAIDDFVARIAADAADNADYGTRAVAMPEGAEVSPAERAAIEREIAIHEVAEITRSIEAGIVVRGRGAGRVELVDNMVQRARRGIVVGGEDQEQAPHAAMIHARGNGFICTAPVGSTPLPAAVAIEAGTWTVSVRETFAVLQHGWAVTPGVARENIDVAAIRVTGSIGPYLAVRESSLTGFPTGVLIEPHEESPASEVMWLASETMVARGLDAVRAPTQVDQERNVGAF
jgi:photosystem II stability/assembly factor-like uncharacterized protein